MKDKVDINKITEKKQQSESDQMRLDRRKERMGNSSKICAASALMPSTLHLPLLLSLVAAVAVASILYPLLWVNGRLDTGPDGVLVTLAFERLDNSVCRILSPSNTFFIPLFPDS